MPKTKRTNNNQHRMGPCNDQFKNYLKRKEQLGEKMRVQYNKKDALLNKEMTNQEKITVWTQQRASLEQRLLVVTEAKTRWYQRKDELCQETTGASANEQDKGVHEQLAEEYLQLTQDRAKLVEEINQLRKEFNDHADENKKLVEERKKLIEERKKFTDEFKKLNDESKKLSRENKNFLFESNIFSNDFATVSN